MVADALSELPTGSGVNATAVALSDASEGSPPPLSTTDCLFPETVSVAVSIAVRTPREEGVKLANREHPEPGPTSVQLSVSEKSAASTPLISIEKCAVAV